MSDKKRSREEFEAYLKSLFENDNLKIKYKNPSAWRNPPSRKNRNR